MGEKIFTVIKYVRAKSAIDAIKKAQKCQVVDIYLTNKETIQLLNEETTIKKVGYGKY